MNIIPFLAQPRNQLYGVGFAVGACINVSTIFLENIYRNNHSPESSIGKRLWKAFDYTFPCGTEKKKAFRFFAPWAIPLVSLIAKTFFVVFTVFKDVFLKENGLVLISKSMIPASIIMDLAILFLPYKLYCLHVKYP